MTKGKAVNKNESPIIIIRNILISIAAAVLGALGMHVFVYPLNLAPMGVDGIATMLQYVTGMNAGYFSIIINIPLLIVAWFVLKKSYVLYTLLFTLVNSGLLVVLREIDFYQFSVENEALIGIICAGVILALRTGIMLRIGASTGGVDIIAAMFQKQKPYLKIESIISILCNIITVASYFVYRSVLSVILAFIMNFIFEYIVNRILRGNRQAVEVKIITTDPDDIIAEIVKDFKHGGYTVEGKGVFSGQEKTVIASVINIRQIPDLMKMCRKYPDSFVYYSSVDGVQGNFRWHRHDEVK